MNLNYDQECFQEEVVSPKMLTTDKSKDDNYGDGNSNAVMLINIC